MTDEQIKQNAEAYAKEMRDKNATEYCTRYFAYLAGAHSRDEEVKRLYNSLEHFRSIINNLRNPWINTQEQLPEVHQDVLIELNGSVVRNDYIGIGDINYMKANPELFTKWMLTPKPN